VSCRRAQLLALRCFTKCGRQPVGAHQALYLGAEIRTSELVSLFLLEVRIVWVQRSQLRTPVGDRVGCGGEKTHRIVLRLFAGGDPRLPKLSELLGGRGECLLGGVRQRKQRVFFSLRSRRRRRSCRRSLDHLTEALAEYAHPGHRISTLGSGWLRCAISGAASSQRQAQAQRDSHADPTTRCALDSS
jgi:hypothetical protein